MTTLFAGPATMGWPSGDQTLGHDQPAGGRLMDQRITPLEDVILAYRETGSVWKAAKRLGLCGQSVWERLRKHGVPMQQTAWTEEEEGELRALYEAETPIAEIGRRLNRTYAGVACKLNELGIKGANRRSTSKKLPRGVGYDKVSILKHMKYLMANPAVKITPYARSVGLTVDSLAYALQKYCPDDYAKYKEEHHGDIKSKLCPNCLSEFLPANGKQIFCSRICSGTFNRDQSYFGGQRSTAIGMEEGVCQLCKKDKHRKSLHAHHVIGKQNDPDNKIMVALCAGCHQLVGLAAKNKGLVESAENWETFIQLAWLEQNGHRSDIAAIYTCVEIEPRTHEQEAGQC